MSDDWGCNMELFGESSSTEKSSKSLLELCDILSKKSKSGSQPNSHLSDAENVKIIPFYRNGQISSSKVPKVHAPKILKKKKNNNNHTSDLSETNSKRVTFEIEQLLSREAAKDDRKKARERILTSLGAAPAKREFVNYKELKLERASQKAEQKAQAELNNANSMSMAILKKKKKNNNKNRKK